MKILALLLLISCTPKEVTKLIEDNKIEEPYSVRYYRANGNSQDLRYYIPFPRYLIVEKTSKQIHITHFAQTGDGISVKEVTMEPWPNTTQFRVVYQANKTKCPFEEFSDFQDEEYLKGVNFSYGRRIFEVEEISREVLVAATQEACRLK